MANHPAETGELEKVAPSQNHSPERLAEVIELMNDWPPSLKEPQTDPATVPVKLARILAEMENWRLDPPLAPRTRKVYESAAANFERFCVLGGAANTAQDVVALPTERLTKLVSVWVQWRLEPCSTDHPLCVNDGKRGSGFLRKPEGTNSPNLLLAAISWWAEQTHRIANPVTAHHRKQKPKEKKDGKGKARRATNSELACVVDALETGDIVSLGDKPHHLVQAEGWHLRQHAALAIAIAGGLRTGEVAMLRDSNLVEVTAKRIVIEIPMAKGYKAKTVVLQARKDVLCPIWSLTRWLEFCTEHNWRRSGFILPGVCASFQNQPLLTPSSQNEGSHWKRVTKAVGLAENTTPHGLRAILPNRAAEQGVVNIRILQRFLGHSSSVTTEVYMQGNATDGVINPDISVHITGSPL
jgi:integrase